MLFVGFERWHASGKEGDRHDLAGLAASDVIAGTEIRQVVGAAGLTYAATVVAVYYSAQVKSPNPLPEGMSGRNIFK